MDVNVVINLMIAVLAFSILHSLSRRHAERVSLQLHERCSADAWIIYFVVFFSLLVVSFHIAGTVALMTGVNLVHIATVTGVLVVLWSADRWLPRASPLERGALSFSGVLSQVRDTIRLADPVVQWSALVAGAIVSLFLLDASTRPPTGWDTVVYHLPLAVKWLQQGSLAFIQESWKFQMPSNGELFPLFLMYLGNEGVLSFVCLPFSLLAVLTVYGLTRHLSASRDEALLASLGFGTMPIVLYNTFNVSVDMFAASFFLSSTYLLLRFFHQHPSAGDKRLSLVAIAGLAFGLGLGARYVYVPLLVFMAGLCASLSMGSMAQLFADRGKRLILTTATFVAGSLLPSVFWYLRNFTATGNPMHPLQFSLGAQGIKVSTKALSERPGDGMPHIEGTQSCLDANNHDMRRWFEAPWNDCWTAGLDHYSENWGLGAVFTTFVPVLTIAVVLLTVATTVRRRQIHPLHILLFVAGVFLAYWWLKLYTMARSIIPVIGILFVVVACGIGVLSGRMKRIAYGLFLCAMVVNGLLLAAKPLQELSSRLHHRIWSHSSYYNVSPLIDELPAGSVVLNASDELKNYPLFGRRWQNRVITDRALLEPREVRVIGNDFIQKWGIEYVYYGTSQKWVLGDEVKREVLSEHLRDDSVPNDKDILYRVLR